VSLQTSDIVTLDPQRLFSAVTALKDGDFSQRLPAGQDGLAGAIADTLNLLFERLEVLASEMNRITRETGIEGRFGGQAEVEGLAGTWKEMIDNLNVMATNLTDQVRDVSQVVAELTEGSRSRRVTVEAQGETLLLKELVNTLVDRPNAR
jgi:HAMP domain-containing protein